MSLLSKPTKPSLIRITRDNPFVAQGIAEVINGAIPSELLPYCEVFDGPAHEARFKIDAKEFAHHVARERELARPTPPASGSIGYRELLRRFGWTDDGYAKARTLGFPASVGRRIQSGNMTEALFTRRDVDAWERELVEFLKVTRFGNGK